MGSAEGAFAEAIDGARKYALADRGLIDEYEFVVHPVLAGRGPTLLSGLRARIELGPVARREFGSGAVAVRYRPRVTRA